MGTIQHIRAVASGLLLLAGIGAVCPQAAHGSLIHEDPHEAAPAVPEHDAESHDHDACAYEVAHTHNFRMSCAPDELASQLMDAYGHVDALPCTPIAPPAAVCSSRSRAARESLTLLRTIYLLL